MADTLGQTADLNVENLFTAFVDVCVFSWNERIGADFPQQGSPGVVLNRQSGTDAAVFLLWTFRCEGIGFAPQCHQSFDVHVAEGQLFAECETFAFTQDRSVFGKYDVGGRFAATGRAVQVGRHRAGRLLFDKRTQVGMFADHLVAGRNID